MHTVELLEQSLAVAEGLGYSIRQEWLGGAGGGACEFGGKKWIFVDLSLSALEQLDQVTTALRNEPELALVDAPAAVKKTLGIHRAA